MKVLVSDIDEKFRSDKDFSNLLNKFVLQGNLFILATDKPINYIVEELALADIEPNYYICNNGAVIFDRYFNVLYRKDIKQELVRPIMNILKEDDNILESFIDTSHGYVQNTDMCANGIVAQPYDAVKAEITLNKITLKFPAVHGYINDNWLNIIDIDVSKKEALKYLEDHYHLKEEDIWVIGSKENDLELVEQYNGYVLKKASEDLKKYKKIEVSDIMEVMDILLKEDEDIDDEAIYV